MANQNRLQTQLTIAGATLIAFTAALWAPQVLNDGDTWWHVAAGRLMIARHALITTDPFSYTFDGRPWLNHEWLADVLFGGAYTMAGWSGVMLLTACAAGAAAWLLARDVGRWLSGLPLIVVLTLALSLIAPHLLARPHILALPLFEAWAAGLIVARAAGRGPRWALLPLMALWANLHGSFFFGLGLAGAFALEAVVSAASERRIAVALRWGGFGAAAVGMALLTPNGLQGLLLPLRLSGMTSLAHIGEWAPADFSRPQPLQIALLVALYAFLSRPVRPAPARVLLLLLLVFLALQHVRHEMLLAIVGALVLAEPLARAYGQGPPDAPSIAPESVPIGPTQLDRDKQALSQTLERFLIANPVPTFAESALAAPQLSIPLALGAIVAVLGLATARLAIPVVRTDGPVAPLRALDAVPPSLAAQPVLNDYAFGGYLIARDVKPFIDSRADMYGDAFVSAYARLAAGDAGALSRVLKRRNVGWTILAPGTPLASAMRAIPGWRLLYADRFAEVEARAP